MAAVAFGNCRYAVFCLLFAKKIPGVLFIIGV